MKLILTLFALNIGVFCFTQSQMEMNQEAKKEYDAIDVRLNKIYNQILKDYSSDKEFIKNLKASERIWIQFRDAEMLMKYPEDSDVREGSVFPLCYLLYKSKLTEERIKTLNQWIKGEEEGEVCSGSVKVR